VRILLRPDIEEIRGYKVTYRVQIISEEEFLKIKDEWTYLLENSESNTIFLTWEWLSTWWKFYHKNKDLFIITVRDACRVLQGIAPLCIKKVNIYGVVPIKILTFLGTDEVCSDYLDFIICRGKEKEILKAIFEFIEYQSDLWDILLISDLSEFSLSLSYLKEILDSRSAKYYLSQAEVCPYIVLPDSVEVYIQQLSKNMRYNLKRRTSNLEKRHAAVFSKWDSPIDTEKVMENLFELHRMRRNMIGREGDFLKEDLKAFHKEVASLLDRKGYVKIYYLSIRGDLIAILYGFQYNDRFFYYQSGMHPAYRKESVGMALMGYCIKDSIANGLMEFDFLRGPEPYKFKWTNTCRKTINLEVVSDSVKGKGYIATRSLLHKVKDIISPGQWEKN